MRCNLPTNTRPYRPKRIQLIQHQKMRHGFAPRNGGARLIGGKHGFLSWLENGRARVENMQIIFRTPPVQTRAQPQNQGVLWQCPNGFRLFWHARGLDRCWGAWWRLRQLTCRQCQSESVESQFSLAAPCQDLGLNFSFSSINLARAIRSSSSSFFASSF
jgi:hypothetical protein